MKYPHLSKPINIFFVCTIALGGGGEFGGAGLLVELAFSSAFRGAPRDLRGAPILIMVELHELFGGAPPNEAPPWS